MMGEGMGRQNRGMRGRVGNDPGKLRRGKLVIGKVSEFKPDTTFGVSV